MLPLSLLLSLLLTPARATYYPYIEYSGTTFFNGFDFYGAIDNTTWGNVTYVTAADATAESLAFSNAAGNAIIKVDDRGTVLDVGPVQYRKSVRLTSKTAFDLGTLFVIDALHMPWGCSVWPSIWLNGLLQPGQVWPNGGEIDLVEAINLMTANQMALHSFEGCVQPANVTQLGQSLIKNCNDTSASGCTVAETKPNSYGPGFNANNGGVFALQFDTAGVFMWFWPRNATPASIDQATPKQTMNLTDWGTPSASYPAAGCNISHFFAAQQLIVDITLCGLWAGIDTIYSQDCKGTCFSSNIAGNGSNYADAYFEIPYIRTYTVNPALAANASASASALSVAQTTGAPSGSVAVSSPSQSSNAAAAAVGGGVWGAQVLLCMWVVLIAALAGGALVL